MAPTETTDHQSTSPSSANQSSSEHITDATPEQPNSSEEAQSETVQNQSIDPSTAGHLQHTVSNSSELTDPATEEVLRGATRRRSRSLQRQAPSESTLPQPTLTVR
jgi:hypothetical protein